VPREAPARAGALALATRILASLRAASSSVLPTGVERMIAPARLSFPLATKMIRAAPINGKRNSRPDLRDARVRVRPIASASRSTYEVHITTGSRALSSWAAVRP
jgi:hypothetical protein